MGIFRMPSLGADMEAGTLVEWLKKPGDRVRSGDILAVVETQKGAIEIEVFESGTIESQLLPVGATVPVGTGLAMIQTADATSAQEAPAAPVISRPVKPPVTPRPKPVATAPIAPEAPPNKASPAARQFAAEHGVDLSLVEGTGPEGAVVYVDVEKAWLHQRTRAAPLRSVSPPGPAAEPGPMRTAIAAAMARSKREIPHYYLGHAVDVTQCLAWMSARNETRPPEERLLFSALLLKSLALALARFPEFNGHFRDSRFEPASHVHAGMAIALRGGGLVAPAIHDTANLTPDQVMNVLRDLTNRVRAGRFRGSELADPTVTLTSLGERGVDWVQPIIYPPQVAIVGAGAPQLRPWMLDGQVSARQVCQLSLAADHRVSDGHRGALLLREIEARLQSPEAL